IKTTMFEQKRQGAVDVIGGGERIAGDRVAALGALLSARADRGQPHVVLDLQGVAVVDSAGLELLLDTQEQYQRLGGALKLANPGTLCREVLKATGVGARFEVYPDTGSAVRSFVL
ncbi:MAG: STAS domain-containing protein, partial [Pirellulales bacterium]